MRVRNAEFGMRNEGRFILSLVMALQLTGVAAAERTWTRSEILAIADGEVRKLGYDVEHMSVSFDVDNSQWREVLERRGLARNVEEKLRNRTYWAISYSALSDRLPDGISTKSRSVTWVLLDRKTAQVIDTMAIISNP